jgi:hypothetical protein
MHYPDFSEKGSWDRLIRRCFRRQVAGCLTGEIPWSCPRQEEKLLRTAERYGFQRTNVACPRALSFDLIDVFRLECIHQLALEKGTIADGGPLRHSKD